MDAQAVAENLEKAGTETALEIAPVGDVVSDETFEYLVRQALDAVHGIMLFKMRLDDDSGGQHVAAASIGDGRNQQFLVLTLPVVGGRLRVETAAKSKSPVARIVASYAGLAQAFVAAA